ncbi:unnamed protein product [Sphagnum jensenii]|uniref:Amino acid transporter transmembrane domain-containing protein n=1 Tax=Sphagnum jensenii TaxID=128206 RepID=A0ABP0VZT6_9BRYO
MAMSNGGIENHNGKVDTNHLVQRGIGNSASELTHLDPELADGNHHVENSNSDTPDIGPSRETVHHVGKDTWWEAGFHLIAAFDNSYVLGYPGLVMAYLGWIAGPICVGAFYVGSFYNNYLLATLHETGGKRHIRSRDLAGHILGPLMYKATWILQFLNLSIATVGSIILCGESLQGIWVAYSHNSAITLPIWVVISGGTYGLFAFFVPTLHSLRLHTAVSIFLSLIFICIAVGTSVNDGFRAAAPRDYSLLGTKADVSFRSIGSLATIAFAFNSNILPEMQAVVRQPAVRNMHKALVMQFTLGNFPIILVMMAAYWAYGNAVNPYLLNSTSGARPWVALANVTAFLQMIVSIHVYALPMYEFVDTFFGRNYGDKRDWSAHSTLIRFLTRGTFIAIATFFGALLPFFGDFVALTGALSVFPLNFGLVHLMYLKVNGKNFALYQVAWHWGMIGLAVILTVTTATASVRQIISDATNAHVFSNT